MINSSSHLLESSQEVLCRTCIDLMEQYEYYLHRMGYKNIVGSSCNYQIIQKINDKDALIKMISHLLPAIETIHSIERDADHNIYDRDELFYIQRSMFLNKLFVNTDLTKIIDDNTVVEIYDCNSIQIYRTFNFFKFCSYTLEEVFTREWWNLFERNDFISNKLVKLAQQILTGETSGDLVETNCPDHWVMEINSKDKLGCYIKQGVAIPLYNSAKKTSSMLITFKVLKYLDKNGDIQNVSKATLVH